MQIEVVQLSKIEKSTDKGIVNVHKATLKGMDYVQSPESHAFPDKPDARCVCGGVCPK